MAEERKVEVTIEEPAEVPAPAEPTVKVEVDVETPAKDKEDEK